MTDKKGLFINKDWHHMSIKDFMHIHPHNKINDGIVKKIKIYLTKLFKMCRLHK